MIKYVPGAQAIGLSIGLIWLTLISTFFACMSVYFLKIDETTKIFLFIFAGVVGLILLTGSGLFLKNSIKNKVKRTDQEDIIAGKQGKRAGILFGIVVTIEVALIVLANIIIAQNGHSEYLIPVDILIVSLHFIPLAWVFDVKPYYFTGITTSAICLFSLLYFPVSKTFGGTQALILIPGNGFVLAIWLTVAYILIRNLNVKHKE